MSSLNDSNVTDSNDQSIVVLNGGSTNTTIGNIGDRLKVDAILSATSLTVINSYDPSKIKYEDMNVSVGGIARDTIVGSTFTNIYSYTGTGYFYGFLITFEGGDIDSWYIRVTFDSSLYPIFGSAGLLTGDVLGGTLYDLNDNAHANNSFILGITSHDNTIIFGNDVPISFSSNISIAIRNFKSSKKFKAGFVKIIKN